MTLSPKMTFIKTCYSEAVELDCIVLFNSFVLSKIVQMYIIKANRCRLIFTLTEIGEPFLFSH